MEVYFAPRMRSRCQLGYPEVCKLVFITSDGTACGVEESLDDHKWSRLTVGYHAKDGVVVDRNEDVSVFSDLHGIFFYLAFLTNTEVLQDFTMLQDFLIRSFISKPVAKRFSKVIAPSALEELESFVKSVGDAMVDTNSQLQEKNSEPVDDITLYCSLAMRYSKSVSVAMMKDDFEVFKKGCYYVMAGLVSASVMMVGKNGRIYSVPRKLVQI